ncbi:hypothetical protein BDR05DRAFT_1004778 [Suillus weaverae]|nr:hypothetical protein BDR05DRAFT_1004778 [Suillus weaverae]
MSQPNCNSEDGLRQTLELSPSQDLDAAATGLMSTQVSEDAPTAREARQCRKIVQLEQKLETLESGRAAKERQTNQYVAQGRALRCVVALYDNVEDLIMENDRRYEEEGSTQDQDRLQLGYVALNVTFPWFQKKAEAMEYDDFSHMLKTLRQGADMARGDDTAKLKALVASWVLSTMLAVDYSVPLNMIGMTQGIRNRSDGYIVTNLSFPSFLYERYTANADNLEEGLFKGRILVQAYKAVFTSPSSAKDVEGDGDGADISANNRRAQKSSYGIKVKKHVAHIIQMKKVMPRSIAYIACQAPGRSAQHRIDRLLEWWTRKVFGSRGRDDISNVSKANMSVNALARQREQMADAEFDST